MPRPSVYSVPLHEVFIEKLGKLNGFVRPACDACGINRSTMLRWLNRGRLGEEPYAQLLADVLSVQASKGELRMATVEAHALADPGTARWLAERTLPAELGLRDKVEAAVVERLEGLLEALGAECDAIDPTGRTSDNLRRAAARLQGGSTELEPEESIDTDAEVVEPRQLSSGDTE